MSPSTTEALLHVSGRDATTFLNAQLTRRVDNLPVGQTALAAWCNAKGRVQALFQIHQKSGDYELRLPGSMLPLVLPRLRMYVLRSQVQIEPADQEAGCELGTALQRIRAGIPQVYPQTREQFLPQMLNLDRLDAIDFKKGCYPGQEIVARSQYLGQVKRRMYHFRLGSAPVTAPVPGMALAAADGASGSLVDAAQDDQGLWQLLAVIPSESAAVAWHLAGDPAASMHAASLDYAPA